MMPVLAGLAVWEYYTVKYYTLYPSVEMTASIQYIQSLVVYYIHAYAFIAFSYTAHVILEIITDFTEVLNIKVFSIRNKKNIKPN